MLLTATGGEHLILLIVFIFCMLLWLIFGVDWARTPETPIYRRGAGLLPWIAVAILGYLMFA